jgi:hypothetical protein
LTATAVFALLRDPTSPSTIYAGTNTGVFRSTDGGASWASFGQGLDAFGVDALAIRPGLDFALYAGTLGGSVWRFPAAAGPRRVVPLPPSRPVPVERP